MIEIDCGGGAVMRLCTVSEIAVEMNLAVSLVSMWANRHERNGFPDPVSHIRARNGKLAAHYDLDEVLEWRVTYVPSKGGWRMHRVRREIAR